MAIRSQLDTSFYGNMNSRTGSVGDLLNLVGGIQQISAAAKQNRIQEKEMDEEQYLNTVYGKHFSGWNGDQNDAFSRNQAAMGEVLQKRPELYSRIAPMIADSVKAKQEHEINEIKRKREELGLQADKYDVDMLGTKYRVAQNELLTGIMADVETVEDYKPAYLRATSLLGKTILEDPDQNPRAAQNFLDNKWNYLDRIVAERNNLTQQAQLAETSEAISKAEKAGIDADYYEREKQAEINAKNRQYTNQGGGNVDLNSLPEGVSTLDYIAASQYATEKYGKRQGVKMTPIILEGMKQGYTLDNIDDYVRFSGQSTDFSGTARQAMQQIWAGKLGSKNAQASFDAFDNLVQGGDKKAISDYIKKSARDAASVDERKQVLGKDRTLQLITEIEADLKAYEDAGGDTNIFTGTVEDFRKKLGYVKDTEMRKIAEKIQTSIMRYRNDVSGKAFSIPESKEYKDLFPSIRSTAALNSAKINALRDVFSGDVRHFYENAMGTDGYNEFVSGVVNTQPPSPDAKERAAKLRSKYRY